LTVGAFFKVQQWQTQVRPRRPRAKVEEAIDSGDKEAAATALRAAQPELMRAVTRGAMHRNTVSRKISRLSARVKAISA